MNGGKRLSWFSDLFKKKTICDLPLEYEMSMDNDGLHHVKVYSIIEGKKEQIQDVEKLFHYGYTINKGNFIYRLNPEELQKLYSISSLNPNIESSGDMTIEIVPPVLKYLRSKHIKEDKKSQSIIVSEKPLEPYMEIKRAPDSGLDIKT